MTIVTNNKGIMNNFASEPKMYYSESPSSEEKHLYVFWGAIALALVTVLAFTGAVVI